VWRWQVTYQINEGAVPRSYAFQIGERDRAIVALLIEFEHSEQGKHAVLLAVRFIEQSKKILFFSP
jgi:hypothetical protein